MKPDPDKLKRIAAEAERAGAVLSAAIARAEGLADALRDIDASAAGADEREIFRALSDAFYRGVGHSARSTIRQHFDRL